MENATKALIIAASVLIVIILVISSIRILSSTRGLGDQTNTVSAGAKANVFNSQFTPYLGKNVSGIQTKTGINKRIANNLDNSNYTISVMYENTMKNPQDIYASINNSYTYYIRVTPNGYDNGYISCISITENP